MGTNYNLNTLDSFKSVYDIESLKRKKYKVGSIITVQNYYANDGATHKRIISNTDDGSGVQLNNGLWANIIHSGKVNVSWFGAKGDGSDDTAFVQKALDSSAGNIFIDKECTVDDIVIKPFKDVSGVRLNAIHIEQQRNSILHNLVIKIRKTTDDNKPFWLVDKANNPGDSKLQIIIENIRFVVDHERDPQNRQGFVIKNESDDGMWDIRLSKLSGDAYFKDLFVLKAGELETYGQEKYGYTWITYCKFDNISWRGSENAFKFLTYNIARGEDSYSTNRKTAPKIGDTVIQNVSVEIVPSSKTFIYAGCGAYNIKVYGTSAFTDYFRTNSYQQGRGYDYIILDNRNSFQKSGMGSRFVVDSHNGDYMAFSVRTSSGYIYPRYTWRQKFDYLKWFDVVGLSYQATDTINKANTFIFPCIFNKNAVSAGDSSCLIIAKVSLKDYYENIHLKVFSYFEEARDYNPQMYIDIAYRDNSMFVISNIRELNRLCYKVNNGVMLIYMVFDKDTNRLDNMFSYIQRTNTEIIGDMYLYSSETNMLEDNPSYKSAEKKVVTVQHKENAIAQIDTPYYARKMEKEGVLQDFDTYIDEKKAYDKQQRQLALERQNAYEKALAENPSISYEEFMKTKPTMLMLVEEPQPSEKLKKFMEKYL